MLYLQQLVGRYRRYDPATRTFLAERSDREYAKLLGIPHTALWRFFSGFSERSWVVILAFIRTFPEAIDELKEALLLEAGVTAQNGAGATASAHESVAS